MPDKIIVTSCNAGEFQDWQDAITMEKFVVGDIIVRCSACKSVLHQRNVSGACPVCRQTFIPGEVRTEILRMSDRKRLRKGQRSRTWHGWWNLEHILWRVSVAGLVLVLIALFFSPHRSKAFGELKLWAVNIKALIDKGSILLERTTQLLQMIGSVLAARVQTFANTPVQEWPNVLLSILK